MRSRITVRQDGRVLTRRTPAWPAASGRVFPIPSAVLAGITRTGGPVHIGL
ncbi:hypothetical protein [Streptomyces sp. NPDC048720]|uniref:hypothetical protein n=1 Tax=Streptomyces sp. NPDC048720 TaxID=3365588 RepID=UPI00371930B3